MIGRVWAWIQGSSARKYAVAEVFVMSLLAVAFASPWLAIAPHLPAGVRDEVLSALATLFVIGIVASGLMTLVLSRESVISLKRLATVAGEMERGNLDEVLTSNKRDEVGDIFASLDAMRDSLRERVREAEATRKEAETAREEAEKRAERLRTHSEAFGEVMARAAAGAVRVDENIEEVASSATQVAETTPDVADSGSETREAAGEAVDELETIENRTEETVESVERLDD